MSELIQRAIAHIDDQAEKSTDPLCKSIAQYIIDNCLGSEENAKRALQSGNRQGSRKNTSSLKNGFLLKMKVFL